MKYFKILCLLISTFTLTTACQKSDPSNSYNTDKVGNGGDHYSAEFVAIASQVVESLITIRSHGIDVLELKKAIKKTKVYSYPSLQLNGRPVDFINSSEDNNFLIKINSTNWEKLESKPVHRMMLVLHEYLGIMGVDDSTYNVSSGITPSDVCDHIQNIRETIESKFDKKCDKIAKVELNKMEVALSVHINSWTSGKNFDYDPISILYEELLPRSEEYLAKYLEITRTQICPNLKSETLNVIVGAYVVGNGCSARLTGATQIIKCD